MSEEFTEEVVSTGSHGRGPMNEDAEDGTVARGDRIEEDFIDGSGMSSMREMPQSVDENLDAIIAARTKPAATEDESTSEEDPPEEVETPAATAPVETNEWQTKATALQQANAALVAELEAEKARPAASAGPTPHKLLVTASDTYIDDPIASTRAMIAASLGIDDPADKRVDDELADLYTGLTAQVLGVTPDDKYLAKRNAARALHLVAREKRERTAEKQTTAEQASAHAEAQKAANAAQFIGNRLTVKKESGKSLADEYPLLMLLAEDLDGTKPEAVIWQALNHETKKGTLVLTADDDANIAAVAKLIETRYQALRDKIAKAFPQPTSTAKPTQSAAKPSQDKTRAPAPARTLTNADASVAPATPPAKKQTTQPPKFKTKEEAKAYALRHLDD